MVTWTTGITPLPDPQGPAYQSEVSKLSSAVSDRIRIWCGGTTSGLPQMLPPAAGPTLTVTLSIVIGLSELLSNRIAPASKVPLKPLKTTPGDPFQGNGKMLPAGRRPSA